MKGFDISDDEFAKSHGRYMIGGSQVVPDERVLRFGASCIIDFVDTKVTFLQNFLNVRMLSAISFLEFNMTGI